jgi:hypothetical protein
MVDSLRVMAQWYNPSMGPKDLKKGLGFKPIGVQVKALSIFCH